jgi:hypothetical protein
MIIVLISARKEPYVAEVTFEQLIDLANDTDGPVSHTQSLPPGVYATDFDKAWAVLCKDLVHARHFVTVEDAEHFYAQSRHELPVTQAVKVIGSLRRLRDAAGSV